MNLCYLSANVLNDTGIRLANKLKLQCSLIQNQVYHYWAINSHSYLPVRLDGYTVPRPERCTTVCCKTIVKDSLKHMLRKQKVEGPVNIIQLPQAPSTRQLRIRELRILKGEPLYLYKQVKGKVHQTNDLL